MAKKRLMALFTCCLMMTAGGCQEEKVAEVKEPERVQEKTEIERRKLSKNFPPVGTAEVKVFSLPRGVSNFLVDGKLNLEIAPSQGIVFSGALLEEAHAALNAPIDHELNFMCWEPRDALIFYDTAGEVVGSVIICFTCYKVKIRPSEFAKNMDYGLLAKVFAHPDLKGGYPFEKADVGYYVSEYREELAKSLERRAKSAGRTVIPEPALGVPENGRCLVSIHFFQTVEDFGPTARINKPIIPIFAITHNREGFGSPVHKVNGILHSVGCPFDRGEMDSYWRCRGAISNLYWESQPLPICSFERILMLTLNVSCSSGCHGLELKSKIWSGSKKD